MAHKTVAQIIVDTLVAAGVRRVYGLVGDDLNGLVAVLQAHGGMQYVGVRHEEAAAFAAGADANIGGGLGVCAGSCGPGSAHLLNGLYDCHRSQLPVLALVAQIPSDEIGSSFYQENSPERLLRECSHYCERIAVPGQAVRVTEAAVQAALSLRGVGVVVLPRDVAHELTEAPAPRIPALGHHSAVLPPADKVAQAAAVLNACQRVTIVAGSGIQGAHAELLRATQALQAPLVHALAGKECAEASNPFDVGMLGRFGMPAARLALDESDGLLLLGTDYPFREYLPEHLRVVQIDQRPERIGRRARVEVGLHGTVAITLLHLLPQLRPRSDNSHLLAAQRQHQADEQALAAEAANGPGLRPQRLTKLLDELGEDDAIYVCDVGAPLVWAERYLHMNGHRRLINSFVHGSMAAALPQAIGAALAAPGRQVIALCGDSSFSMLLSSLLTLHRTQVPVKAFIYNNAVADAAELNPAAAAQPEAVIRLDNPDFARLAEAAGIRGLSVRDPARLAATLQDALGYAGAVVVDVHVSRETPQPTE